MRKDSGGDMEMVEQPPSGMRRCNATRPPATMPAAEAPEIAVWWIDAPADST